MREENVDLLIVGAGSAAFGAAWQVLAAGSDLRIKVVDKHHLWGGSSTVGGVSNWEPGVSGRGVHFALAGRLLANGGGYVGKTTLFCDANRPYALTEACEDPYESTLRRHGLTGEEFRRFVFTPEAMSEEMAAMIGETDGRGRLDFAGGWEFVDCSVKEGKIISCDCKTGEEICRIYPRMVLDCSGDIVVARAAGCACVVGDDAGNPILNGMTQCFTAAFTGEKQGWPEGISPDDLEGWDGMAVSCIYRLPDGRLSVNMLPTMEGAAILTMDSGRLGRNLRARACRYWQKMAARPEFDGYTIDWMAPLPGIRESWRLVGKVVLKHQDLLDGSLPAHTAAMADHPADIHGAGAALIPTGRYGIPYECMLPNEVENLLVACRGASFSHLAASSARLSRTMMALGEAAGIAAEWVLTHEGRLDALPDAVFERFPL